MKYFSMLVAGVTLCSAFSAHANYGVSLYGGQTASQNIITTKNETVNLDDATHFAVSIDKHLNNAKYGFYYSSSTSELENQPNREVDLEYLVFQSAAIVPFNDNFASYLGAQIGVNKVSPQFSESDSFFVSGLYTGLDYKITDNMLIGTELRWLATIVKNTSKVSCGGDELSTSDNCIWHFDGDVLNQFQASVSFTLRF